MLYMVTFTIDIPQMLAYIPYMDPMGIIYISNIPCTTSIRGLFKALTGTHETADGMVPVS